MSNIEEKQVNTLIRWGNVRLGVSDIQGIGVFAIRDIEEGTKLYMDIMPMIFKLPYKKIHNNLPEKLRDLIVSRWPKVVHGDPFVFPDARYVAYCNHADDPNYDAQNDVALKFIKEGEEITEDYRKIEGWEQVYSFLQK